MCGIAGVVLTAPAPREQLQRRASAMNSALAHRGPDGDGVWTDPDAGVALAQRRLAIIDLSEAGAQPMVSASGRLVMTYNGEIYNFRELRRDLEAAGCRFRGGSDSEVLIEAWDHWGEEKTLARLTGMFAIAMWDRQRRRLTLVRDHLGIKPLAYALTAHGLLFASEVGALLKDAACPRQIDPAAFAAYIRHGAVPAPWTIFAGVRKLEPGQVLTWSAGDADPVIRTFWSAVDVAEQGEAAPLSEPWDALVSEGEALIADAVERQMIADVPLGAFLSGGIDSSLVAALMHP